MIIGICGLIGSGKDTVADYLVSDHNFTRAAFAGSVKDALSVIFDWDREMLEGRTAESRAWRDKVDPWWANQLSIPELSPRWAMQHFGTEVMRNCFHDDIWVSSLENKLRKTATDVVVTDCRFANEIACLKVAGAQIIRVKRGPDPSWWDTAIEACCGNTLAMADLHEQGVHTSEYSWAAANFDIVLENDSTIEDLYMKVKNQVVNRPAST